MFERFTERARQVVVVAQEEARALHHNYIGTEHLLLGLIREDEGLAARALSALDVELEQTRRAIAAQVGAGEEPVGGQIPFTPRSKKVLELALREALALGHNYIGTEHILLGLTSEPEGMAIRILLERGLSVERVRDEMLAVVAGAPSPLASVSGPPAGPPPGLRDPGSAPWIQIRPGKGLQRLFMTAGARALDEGRSVVEPADLLLALTQDPSTAGVLAGLGVDEAVVRRALGRGAESEPPPAAADG